MTILRTIALFILSSCFPAILHAQDIIYSDFEDFDFRTGDYNVAGKSGNRFYIYRGTKDGFFLDAYDEKMDKMATVILDFFPPKVSQVRFITYPDRLMVLYQGVDGSKVTQYAALMDQDAKLLKKPIRLDEEKSGLFNGSKNYFSSAVSENKKNILVYGISTKGKDLKVECTWIDDELNIKGKSNAAFKADNSIEYGEALLNNDGSLFLPIYTPIGNRSYADGIWLLNLQQGEKAFSSKELPLDKMYASGTFMKLDTARARIYICGFFSDKKNGNFDGVFNTYYDINSREFRNRKTIEFDEKMRVAAASQSEKRAYNDYQARKIIVRTDGGFIMVSEDYFITNRNNYAPGFGYYSWYYPVMSSSIREYHYNDIMAMSFNEEGAFEWQSFIRKQQYSQEDGGLFSSFLPINTGGMLGFLFNDFNMSRSRIQLAGIDADGKAEIHSLAAGNPDDRDWMPRSGKQVGSREIVVPCLRRRQICFAKVVF